MKKVILMAVASTMMAQAAFADTTRVTVTTEVTTQVTAQQQRQADTTLDAIGTQVKNMMIAGNGSISPAQLGVLTSAIQAMPLQQRLALIDASIKRAAQIKEELARGAQRFGQVYVAGFFGAIFVVSAALGMVDGDHRGMGLFLAVPAALLVGTSIRGKHLQDKDLEDLNRMTSDIGSALLQVRTATLNQIQAQEL